MGRILPELRWESFQLALWAGTLGGLSPTGMHEHRDFESWGDLRRSIYHIIFFLYDYDHIRRQAVREGAPTVGQSMFPSPSFSGSDVAPVSEAAAGLHDAGWLHNAMRSPLFSSLTPLGTSHDKNSKRLLIYFAD